MDEDEKLKKALIRKALGYSVKEETVEFSRDDTGGEVVSKRKVSRKHIPPDISALKMLLEHFFTEEFKDVEEMTDEELQEEREKIIELLKEEERNALKNGDNEEQL